MRILIAGGTGFLGRALAKRLIREGHAVTVLTRDILSVARLLPPEAERLSWNSEPFRLPDNLSAIIQLSGSSIAQWPWSRRRKDLLVSSRVATTRKLLEAVSRMEKKPEVFLSASGMGYYGKTGEREVHSKDPAGTDFLGRLASSWENEVFKAHDLGMRTAVLRLGMVLGRGGGALPKMALPFRWGMGAVLGSGNQFWPWIHRDDAVEMFIQALSDPAYSGSYQAVAGEPVTQREFSKILAATLHRPCLFRIPEMALRLGLGEMAELFLHGQRARHDAPGFNFRFGSLRDAILASL